VHIPAGTVIMLCLGAANRDPRKFENPNEFRIDRKNVREHIAFGRGIHTCAGPCLASLILSSLVRSSSRLMVI
ncbi:cytochrome P450, partial [Mycobacterium avium]|uniref:cytochrome P450 n=1 Tax=Mycobacterium avium TaxID=1764 RepID=UPI0012DAD476